MPIGYSTYKFLRRKLRNYTKTYLVLGWVFFCADFWGIVYVTSRKTGKTLREYSVVGLPIKGREFRRENRGLFIWFNHWLKAGIEKALGKD